MISAALSVRKVPGSISDDQRLFTSPAHIRSQACMCGHRPYTRQVPFAFLPHTVSKHLRTLLSLALLLLPPLSLCTIPASSPSNKNWTTLPWCPILFISLDSPNKASLSSAVLVAAEFKNRKKMKPNKQSTDWRAALGGEVYRCWSNQQNSQLPPIFLMSATSNRKYGLVQWNRFSDFTGCTWIACIQ